MKIKLVDNFLPLLYNKKENTHYEEEFMKNKKIIFGVITIIVIILITIAIIWIQNKQTEEKVKATLTDFIDLINKKDYEAMYDKVANINMSKEDFISRNKNIYEGIESQNIKVENITLEKKEDIYQVNYHETMYTRSW